MCLAWCKVKCCITINFIHSFQAKTNRRDAKLIQDLDVHSDSSNAGDNIDVSTRSCKISDDEQSNHDTLQANGDEPPVKKIKRTSNSKSPEDDMFKPESEVGEEKTEDKNDQAENFSSKIVSDRLAHLLMSMMAAKKMRRKKMAMMRNKMTVRSQRNKERTLSNRR